MFINTKNFIKVQSIVSFLGKYFFCVENLVFQSDTMGSELRIMVTICLNHDRDEGQICQIVYLRAVI